MDGRALSSNPLAPITYPTSVLGFPMVKQARRIIVHGMVQGVGFRMFVERMGRRHGLTGDVRNLRDGTVEIVAEGPSDEMKEFIEEVRKGPSMAYVERLEIHEIASTGRYHTFMIEGL